MIHDARTREHKIKASATKRLPLTVGFSVNVLSLNSKDMSLCVIYTCRKIFWEICFELRIFM